MINPQLEESLRNMKVAMLQFLLTLSSTSSLALELDEISKSTDTAEKELRGIIGTLLRIKINDKTLILPAGRDDMGRLRWQINEDLVDKKELAKFLEEKIIGLDGLKIARTT